MQPLQQASSTDTQAPVAQTCAAVILAGRLRESPLRESLDVHVLCLPVGPSGTLLEAWLEALRPIVGLSSVRVVVNSEEDVAAVRSALPRETKPGGGGARRPTVEVMAEPAAWRGAGGIVRDVTDGLADDAIVLVCEGKRLPPPTLTPLIDAMRSVHPSMAGAANGHAHPAGAVAVSGNDEPAGVYAFSRRVIPIVPRVGYFDLKEQFLPVLARSSERVIIARLSDEVRRLRDRESYLGTVEHSLAHGRSTEPGRSMQRVSSRASVSGSAILEGFCIIEPGAVVEDGAVVHDSVVLWGATIGGGAVVSRSIVGPLASVEPRARALRTVVARSRSSSRNGVQPRPH